MTGRSRRRLRAVALVGLAGMLVALGLAFSRRFRSGAPAPAIAPVDGWAARGVRFSRDGDHGARLRVHADAVATAPVHLGVFSVGFLERLDASGVDVDIDLGAARDPRDLRVELQEALGAMAGPGARGKRFSGGRIRGLVVRVRAPERAAFELRAGRCDVDADARRPIHLRDGVVVRSGRDAWTFDDLVYDGAAERFVASDGPAAATIDASALASANAALRGLGARDR